MQEPLRQYATTASARLRRVLACKRALDELRLAEHVCLPVIREFHRKLAFQISVSAAQRLRPDEIITEVEMSLQFARVARANIQVMDGQAGRLAERFAA